AAGPPPQTAAAENNPPARRGSRPPTPCISPRARATAARNATAAPPIAWAGRGRSSPPRPPTPSSSRFAPPSRPAPGGLDRSPTLTVLSEVEGQNNSALPAFDL